MTRALRLTAALLTACSCGSVTQTDDAGPAIDAPRVDGAVSIDAARPIDAAIDASTPSGPPPSAELPAASGRASGGTYTFDVEVGLPFSQGPSVGGGYLIQASTTVKP